MNADITAAVERLKGLCERNPYLFCDGMKADDFHRNVDDWINSVKEDLPTFLAAFDQQAAEIERLRGLLGDMKAMLLGQFNLHHSAAVEALLNRADVREVREAPATKEGE